MIQANKYVGQIPIRYLEIYKLLVKELVLYTETHTEYEVEYDQDSSDQGINTYVNISTFDFGIRVSIEIKNGKSLFIFYFSPTDRSPKNWIELEFHPDEEVVHHFQEDFKKWKILVDRYFDLTQDPILQQYEEEYYSEIKMNDPDADTAPFDFDSQLKIHKYLEASIEVLEKNRTEKNSEPIDDAIKEAKGIQEDQTNLTKNETMSRMSKFWAKCRKISITLAYEVTKGVIVKALVGLLGM